MSVKKKKFIKPDFKIIRLERDQEIQLQYYRDPEFSDEQVTEIYKGFSYGLSKEDIDKYADYNKTPEEMKNIRISLMKNKK